MKGELVALAVPSVAAEPALPSVLTTGGPLRLLSSVFRLLLGCFEGGIGRTEAVLKGELVALAAHWRRTAAVIFAVPLSPRTFDHFLKGELVALGLF